ncbi:MAG: glycosyltransferase [Pirellulaceae bacterium]
MTRPLISVIIPARNEERWIERTVQQALLACNHLERRESASGRPLWELLVVDNASTDRTVEALELFQVEHGVKVIRLESLGAARARNAGRRESAGQVLVFVDADTTIPVDALTRVWEHCRDRHWAAGITSLGSLDGGVRARIWWSFWNNIRRLPLAKAKAMPAFMFCTAAAFDAYGPFDEQVAIGEEWPILAGLYRHSARDVIYDRTIVARSSSRRMEHGHFGYTRTLFKYVWAIVHVRGRIHYTDEIR